MALLLNARRENLRRIVQEHGGPSATAKLLGHSNGTYLPQLIGPRPIRDISERVARSIEIKLQLPAGSLDLPIRSSFSGGASDLLKQALLMLLDELEPFSLDNTSDQQFANLCAATLAQFRENGQVSHAYIQRIVRLVRARE